MNDIANLRKAWDVLVVGAGPAGSAAAIASARQGLDVLLVDAKQFPRRKVCGGCLNQVSVGLLRQLLGEQHPLWEATLSLNKFQLTHRHRQFSFMMPEGKAVDRSQLDQSLVEAAQLAGVTFLSPVTAKLTAVAADRRSVELSSGSQRVRCAAKAVVLASGLGTRTASALAQLQQSSRASSRVGVEAIFGDFPPQYVGGLIHMVVAGCGYVGLTQIADQRLHVAAAVDRAALQQLGPEGIVGRILEEAGAPALVGTDSASWRGTPPLTARARRLSAERVFLVGDAAGYVEPFTGEGIRWALETGLGVAPYVAQAQAAWRPNLVEQWESWYRRKIQAEQRLCRCLASGLKHTAARWIAHQALCLQPRIAASIIARLNLESNS